jgi:hypothetical protein
MSFHIETRQGFPRNPGGSRQLPENLDEFVTVRNHGKKNKLSTKTMPSAALAKGSAALVDQLGRFIEEQRLEPGDRLPSIRDLADQFGVKAGLVRDALLDAQGRGNC